MEGSMGRDASMSEGKMSGGGVCNQGNGYNLNCFVVVINIDIGGVFVGVAR